jgi:anti-sigma factor ChrR (cupin superfamily)
VKLLSHDGDKGDYSALVRLSRGAILPRRRHVGVEEMWMVEGVALIGEVEIRNGEYVRADAGTEHPAIRSISGCTFLIRGNENDEILSDGKSVRPRGLEDR